MVIDAEPIAQLWLPWFVHRSDPSRPVVGPLESQPEIAQQVRVRNLSHPLVQRALDQPDPGNPSVPSHVEKIGAQARRLAGAAVVAIFPVQPVAEGWVLLDGCHRACAMYRLDATAVADLIVAPHLDELAFHPMPRSTELAYAWGT